ncbi:MAG TPA: CAP domain-containing protein [Gemmatimonadaceae bacterium]|nr:CAP domain-containing protein [Gemmatimonadaceae bacterium]
MVARRTFLLGIALTAYIAAPARLGGPTPTTMAHAAVAQAPAAAHLEEQLLALVNADRGAHALTALEVDPDLAAIARWRSEDMVARGYFSHDIGGYQIFRVLKDQGIVYRVAGENLAYNYLGDYSSAAAAEDSLMRSPGHRANILRHDYTRMGIGVAVAPDGRIVYTQLFTASQ